MTTNLVMRDQELPRLAKRINEREDTIDALLRQFQTNTFALLTEGKLQGQDLIAAKDRLPKAGFFEDWLKANCSRSALKANTYVGIAKRWEKVCGYTPIEGARCVQLLLLENTEEETTTTEARKWPAFIEGCYRIDRAVKYIDPPTVLQWPQANVVDLSEKLKPLIAVIRERGIDL